jgi:hemoglobin-like flavoprotein
MPDPNLCEAPMTPKQIRIVKTSFAAVAPIAEQAGMMFYGRLFTVDPSLRPLFKGDIEEQSRTLMRMIAVAVNGLDQLDTIVPAVQALGVRHAGYGVTNAHYDTVAGALLWTLGQGLGAAFTPEVEAAWVEAYTLLATTMQAAAREAA